MGSTDTINKGGEPGSRPQPLAGTAPKEATGIAASYAIGLPRAGTTLLGNLLAGGDNQLSLSEPYLAFDILGRWRLPIFFNRLAKKAGLKPLRVPTGHDERAFADYLLKLASLNNLRHVVIKETYRDSQDWANADLLTRLTAPPAGAVAIHRHPYDIAVSTIRFCKYWRGITGHLIRLWIPRLPLFATDRHIVEHVASDWQSFFHWCEKHKIPTIRYEDLVKDPEVTLRKACEACRIEYQPQMIDHTHARGAFGGIGAPEVMNRPPRAINTQSVGRKKLLDPEFWTIMTERCGEEANLMGYDM